MQIDQVQGFDPAARQQKLIGAAREFESFLLTTVLGPLERAFADISHDEEMAGSKAYQSLGIEAMAKSIAGHGGIGLADMIVRSIAHSKDAEMGVPELKVYQKMSMEHVYAGLGSTDCKTDLRENYEDRP